MWMLTGVCCSGWRRPFMDRPRKVARLDIGKIRRITVTVRGKPVKIAADFETAMGALLAVPPARKKRKR